MPSQKTRVPAVEGWFTLDDPPSLLGSQCTECGTYSFPRETVRCKNPECAATEFTLTELSRRGTVWSYTNAAYQPPKPYVAADPYVPFSIAAVELAREKMVVMGQVVPGVPIDSLTVGTEVVLVLDTLYEDDEHQYMVWKWSPVTGAGASVEGGNARA